MLVSLVWDAYLRVQTMVKGPLYFALWRYNESPGNKVLNSMTSHKKYPEPST